VGHSDRVGNGVGNKRGSVDSVGKNRGGVHSVGNDGGGVGNRGGHRVGSLTRVGDLSHVSINIVCVVGDGLDTSVRKVDRVGALNNTGAIVALGLAEGSLGVVVGNPVVVCVGGDLSQVTNNRGSVGNSVDNRGMVDNRGSVDGMSEGGSVGNHRGGMDKRGSVGNRVSNNAVGKTVSDDTVGKAVVGESRGSVGNYWSGVGNSMVGNWVSHMGSQGNNSSVSDRDRPVGSDGRLDLREALGVVRLSD